MIKSRAVISHETFTMFQVKSGAF